MQLVGNVEQERLKRAYESERARSRLVTLQSLDQAWKATTWRQLKLIGGLTLMVGVLSQVAGNWAVIGKVLSSATDAQVPAWHFRATLSPGDMQGVVTQCLAVLATLTIAVVASPIVGRVRNRARDAEEVTFDAIVNHRWTAALARIAALIAAVANAVALSGFLALHQDQCPGCSPGLSTLLLFLAGAGSWLVAVAMRPSNDGLVANALMDAEIERTQAQVERLDTVSAATMPPRHALARPRSWCWRWYSVTAFALNIALTPLVSLFLIYRIVSWGERMISFDWDVPLWIYMMYVQLLIAALAAVLVVLLSYWRWSLLSNGSHGRTVSVLRFSPLTPIAVALGLYLSFTIGYVAPADEDPILLRTTAGVMLGLPALVCSFFAYVWDASVGRVRRKELEEWVATLRKRRVEGVGDGT